MKHFWGLFFMLFSVVAEASTGTLKGTVKDKTTGEALIGATVQIVETGDGVITDIDGNYSLSVKSGSYTIVIRYISYKSIEIPNVKINKEKVLNILLEPDELILTNVFVTAKAKNNTEAAVLNKQRNSLVVQSGISSQQISRTTDKDASEVIRRIPGISIIDDKFVIVRGLSQRYNNARINGGAIPSSEADSRAFSFDLIPSSQLDNMIVVKSPAPEYPADFAGGFVIIQTKDIPTENKFSIGTNIGLNTQTHFQNFDYTKGSNTDFLGFDNGLRSLKGGIHSTLHPVEGIINTQDLRSIDLLKNGFNNDWSVQSKKPMADFGLNMNISRHYTNGYGKQWGLLGSVNYSNSYKRYADMENSLFGAYDTTNDRSTYLRKATDNQYNHDIRLGAMFNLSYVPNGNNLYEWKNIFNLLGKNRYTHRTGLDAQENNMESAEYYYSSRSTYNGQFTGKHTFHNNKLDWNAGYAFSGRKMPDRRRYSRSDEGQETGIMSLIRANDIRREYTDLQEHIWSGSVNYEHSLSEIWKIQPLIKMGIYGEYRNRTYATREFLYNWNAFNDLPKGFELWDIPREILQQENYGANKIYLIERPKWRNNYKGENTLMAGYLSLFLPVGKMEFYAGLRYEHNRMKLIRHTKDIEYSPQAIHYTSNDLFPSINIAYKMNEKQQFRLSYGRSVNRPEFREVSPSVFYDFELGSSVQGNTELKSAFIDNTDLRYEFYPSVTEQISIALFHKHFKLPIEWTYTMTGGETPVYSFHNAEQAYSMGVEVDIRKDLSFIGLKNFTLSLNGALIKSKVTFEDGSDRNRPMQGQSPYLINGGLFYRVPSQQIDISLLYNRIGKRIIGVGRTVGTIGGENTVNIPDSYEMPRNSIDLNISKRFGTHWLCKLGIKDVLDEKVFYKQFSTVTTRNGEKTDIEEITKSYRPGRQIQLQVSYTF
ncbi:MAG: TonB-dependent receptor [Phocaeicola sp.]|nr:TonB-dependent receptor [Phocaeicola sp.]